MTRLSRRVFCGSVAAALVAPTVHAAPAKSSPVIIAHRGLLLHSPENTLPNFSACLQLRLGFEFDVRRSRDGALVCIHDDTLDRTTDGRGPVNTRTLAELRQFDAGSWFASEFQGTRVPTIDEVLRLIATEPNVSGLYAVDMKADDDRVENDVMKLAQTHGVVDRLLFIGRTIDHVEVRQRLRQAEPRCHTAALANRREDLSQAIGDPHADWVYLRFVPTAADIAAIRAAGKRSFIAGAKVAGLENANWSQATEAGIDAILTDYPLELRRHLATLRR